MLEGLRRLLASGVGLLVAGAALAADERSLADAGRNLPFAEQAYALIEEETILEWSGSSGIHPPADVERRLTELRELIDGS